MSRFVASLAAAGIALSGVSAHAETAQERAEARFAELTEGREAGEPQACVPAFRTNDIEVIDNLGIVYERGDTIWIARAVNPRSLGRSDIPVIDRFGGSLCSFDVIRTIDRSTRFATGAVLLEDFVPYVKQG